jgi:hypothetical protein
MMATTTRKEVRMAEKKTRLKPSSKGRRDPRDWAKKAREFNERLAAQGRYFGDSTEIIRADRDSRV